MVKLLLKNQIHVLVTIQGSNTIENVDLSLCKEGFAYQIEGKVTPELGKQIEIFLKSYSQRENAPLPLLDWEQLQTPFTKKVLEFLTTLSFGKFTTYKGISHSIKAPKGYRAVGGACGRNPFPLFIPCHRVLAHDGRLGGFSCGLEVKKNLLAFERIAHFA